MTIELQQVVKQSLGGTPKNLLALQWSVVKSIGGQLTLNELESILRYLGAIKVDVGLPAPRWTLCKKTAKVWEGAFFVGPLPG